MHGVAVKPMTSQNGGNPRFSIFRGANGTEYSKRHHVVCVRHRLKSNICMYVYLRRSVGDKKTDITWGSRKRAAPPIGRALQTRLASFSFACLMRAVCPECIRSSKWCSIKVLT